MQIVEIFGRHVVAQLRALRAASASSTGPPLFVAMQGPQGSGKTTVARALVDYVTEAGYTIGVMSMDDLYLSHAGLEKVSQDNSTNKLLSGRGQPGTHDVPFGTSILHNIYRINTEPSAANVRLPVFDKSQLRGQGDRAAPDSGPLLSGPLDVFVLEGWSMGFSSITPEAVEQKWQCSSEDSPLRQHTLQHLQQINQNLKEYERWYRYFTIFLQIAPDDLNNVYTWRQQQEHAMKDGNGGQGMSDSEVKAFVDRYMPGYLLFLDTIQQNAAWTGRSKTVTIDLSRACTHQQDW